MPISLILTPFDHFQIRPTFAVTPNLILEPCHIQKENTFAQDHDIAIIQLAQPVQFSDSVAPVSS